MGGLGGKWICCSPQLGGIMTRIITWAGKSGMFADVQANVQWDRVSSVTEFLYLYSPADGHRSTKSRLFPAWKYLLTCAVHQMPAVPPQQGWSVCVLQAQQLLARLDLLCAFTVSRAQSQSLWHIMRKWTLGHSMHYKGFWISFWDVQARNEWAPDNSPCRMDKAMVTLWFDLSLISPSRVVVILRMCCLGKSW